MTNLLFVVSGIALNGELDFLESFDSLEEALALFRRECERGGYSSLTLATHDN